MNHHLAHPQTHHKDWRVVAALLLVASVLLLIPHPAHAQSFNVPFLTEFGCEVVRWMRGPLAVLIFIIVVVATFVIGMIAKMDWSRVITIAILFGIVTGLGAILARYTNFGQMSACLI